MQAESIIQQVFGCEADCLVQAILHIEPQSFDAAVSALIKAPRIAASGCGHSEIACRHFVHLMCCAEQSARFLAPSDAVHGGCGG